jgi:phosphoenolpyruvate phosphomutase
LDEALKRAEAYHEAGADAILMHSARRDPNEILAFKKAWGNRCPVVIVPTQYYQTPTAEFRQAGCSLVIWANHLMRSSLVAMQPAILKLSWNSSFFPFPASFLGAASRVAAGNLLGKKEKGKMSPSASQLRIAAMQQTARQIFLQQSLIGVEERVAPLEEVFRLQGEPELAEAEKRYLPVTTVPEVRVPGRRAFAEVRKVITGSFPKVALSAQEGA